MQRTAAFRFDKLAWFPDYEQARKLHAKVMGKDGHNEIGPGGFLDRVIDWVVEANTYYVMSGKILECHYVPDLKGFSKPALAYEQAFLKTALALWKRTPRTLVELFPIKACGQWLTFLIVYNEVLERQEQPPEINELTVVKFTRPKKKST